MIRGEIALPSAVIFLAYMAGCTQQQIAAVAAPPPPSGPEVFIPNTPSKYVRYRVISKLLSIGASLEQDAGREMTFSISSSNLAYRMLLGRSDPDTRGRIHLQLADLPNGTRVRGSLEFVTHPHTEQEQSRPAREAELPKMQGVLQLLRDSFASTADN